MSPIRSVRSIHAVRSLLAAAGLVSTLAGTSLAQTTTTQRLDQAADLLSEGKVVQARSLLVEVTSPDVLSTLDEQQRVRALSLVNNASRRIKTLPAEEVSLQTAEQALESNDLRTTLAQANAVVTSPKATNAQVGIAKDLIHQATEQQARIAPAVGQMLDDAIAAYEAGDTAKAREGLTAVSRTGIALNADQQDRLDTYQLRLVTAQPVNASMGMLTQEGQVENRVENQEQPGVVTRPTTPPPPAPDQPAETPAADAPAETPTEAPAAQPAPELTEVVSPSQPPADSFVAARRVEAEALMAEADAALSENRLVEASTKYETLSTQFADLLSPDERNQVAQRLAEARVRLGANTGSGDVLAQQIATDAAAKQAAVAEFDNFMTQSQVALDQGDTTRARDMAAQARVRIASARNIFSQDDIEAYGKQVDARLAAIAIREAEMNEASIARTAEENAAAAREQEMARIQSKSRQINEAIDRVRALQAELKYEEALQIVNSQILFLDPVNPTGLLLREVFEEAIIYRTYAETNRTRYNDYARHQVQNVKALQAPLNVLDYPADWPAISERRGAPPAFAEAEENRKALAVIQSKRIPVNFNETPLENVIQFIEAVTQLNVDTDWQALENAGVDRQAPVTLNLTNVPVETILNRVCEKASPDPLTGAAWNVTDGVLTISSREQINKQKAIVIYDIRDLIVEVPNYTNSYELDLQQALQQAGQTGGGGGGQSPFTENDQGDEEQRRTLQERTQEILDIITTNVDSEGWRENGGDVGYVQQLGGLLIITNTPANHRSINGLLAKLREYRAMQINVETRFLLVSQDFFEQIGFDLDVYLNANSNAVRAARTTRPTTRPSDFFDPTSGRYRATYPQSGPDSTGANTNRTPFGNPWSPVGGGQNSLGLAESLISSDFSSEVLTQGPALALAGEFLDDIQVDFLIKATQADRRNISLNAPRLTFTNGQISNIVVATQIAYVADLEPQVSESSAAFDPTPGRLIEGVTMIVDGTVSADRRYVTMNVDSGVSRLERIENQAVTAIAGGQLVNSASVQSFIQLPVVTVTRVQTTVTVPDQGTILLGGQRLTTEAEVESGVPVLSKIPILNRFFTNRVISKEDQTLLILMKPTILIQNEEEERAFPGIEESLRMPYGG
ncbi:MAG TPA: hypothetical protein VHN77_11525 [Phycisphaerales bacterium]|nr:hypothetical protein [Phycisphaerales bacterium]